MQTKHLYFVTISSKQNYCSPKGPTSKDPENKVFNIQHKLSAPYQKHQGVRINKNLFYNKAQKPSNDPVVHYSLPFAIKEKNLIKI